jgi:hypothetical protein
MTQTFNAFVTNKPRLIATILVGILALPVLAHVYNGSFTRMMADDYCFATTAQTEGFWGSLVYWFENWSGGHSSILGQSAVALAGPGAAGLLPGLLLIVWLAALIWGVYEFWQLCGLRYPQFFAFFLGTLMLYTIVIGIPNVYQAVYWTSGSLTYTAPMVVTTLYAGYALALMRRNLSGIPLLVSGLIGGVITFIAGGFSETTVALQIVLLGFAIIGAWLLLPSEKKRGALIVLGMGLIGTLVAFVVTLAAPGNAVREATFTTSLSLVGVGLLTIQNAAAFIAMQLAFFSLIPILVCLILSGLAAYTLQPIVLKSPLTFRRALKWMALVLGIGFILIMASLAPAAYGMNKMPTSRAWIVSQTLLVLVVVSWGFAMGLSLPNRRAEMKLSGRVTAIALVLLVIGPLFAAMNTFTRAGDLRTYAAEWDSRDQSIRKAVANGENDLTLSPYSVDMATFANLNVMDETATGDFVLCMQDYYGLQSVKLLAQTEGDT